MNNLWDYADIFLVSMNMNNLTILGFSIAAIDFLYWQIHVKIIALIGAQNNALID